MDDPELFCIRRLRVRYLESSHDELSPFEDKVMSFELRRFLELFKAQKFIVVDYSLSLNIEVYDTTHGFTIFEPIELECSGGIFLKTFETMAEHFFPLRASMVEQEERRKKRLRRILSGKRTPLPRLKGTMPG